MNRLRLANFNGFALTKSEMKEVRGGSIICSTQIYLGDGIWHVQKGYCGSDDLAVCSKYKPACGGGATCKVTCDYA